MILLDRRAKGIIAEGDPRRLRDESDRPARPRSSSAAKPKPSPPDRQCAMSLKANYFKLGLFVIGAIIAGVHRCWS